MKRNVSGKDQINQIPFFKKIPKYHVNWKFWFTARISADLQDGEGGGTKFQRAVLQLDLNNFVWGYILWKLARSQFHSNLFIYFKEFWVPKICYSWNLT